MSFIRGTVGVGVDIEVDMEIEVEVGNGGGGRCARGVAGVVLEVAQIALVAVAVIGGGSLGRKSASAWARIFGGAPARRFEVGDSCAGLSRDVWGVVESRGRSAWWWLR